MLDPQSGRAQTDNLDALNRQVVQLYQNGEYAKATEVAKRALALAESELGPHHPEVGTTLNNLAGLYHYQGRTAEAEPLYKRSLGILEKTLAIQEKTLGPNHLNVAMTLFRLAWLYGVMGRYREAERIGKRTLAILEKALGLDHPDVSILLNDLGGLYLVQRDNRPFGKAEQPAC